MIFFDGIEGRIVRSRRKSVGIEIHPDGSLIVRAPIGASQSDILRIVKEKESWIRKHLQIVHKRQEAIQAAPKLTAEELQALADEAVRIIPERVAYYAPKVGVTYGRITIRNQRTRWGSCSAKGNLNFNCLLMLAPREVLDSVVVHELCHRKEMNHSARFYAEVRRVFPEYDKWHGWLKLHGAELMQRMC